MFVRKMNKQKIATQLQELDSMVFRLRMAVTALQSEFNESVTVSTTVPTEHYNTTLFDASPQSRESESKHGIYGTVPLDKHDEVEASQVEPDGFHGKSYKDFKKNQVLPEWKNALCAGKSLSALARR